MTATTICSSQPNVRTTHCEAIMRVDMNRRNAIALNNKAAASLQIDRPQEPMRLLRQAALELHNSSSAVSNAPQGPPVRNTKESKQRSRHPASNESYAPGLRSKMDDTPAIQSVKLFNYFNQVSSSAHDDDSLQLIYTNALILSDEEEDDELIAATILYHMALIHHLYGVHNGKRTHMNEALRLYQTALVVLDRCDVLSSAACRCSSINLLRLVLLNNSSHIFLSTYHRKGFLEMIDYMCDIMNEQEGAGSPHEEDDYAFFYMNALVCSQNLLNVAPAA